MKKFLSYSIIVTLFIVVMGAMFIFGVFDIRNGSIDLIGLDTKVNPIDIHNEIVEDLHTVALTASEASILFNQLNPEADLNPIKSNVDIIQNKLRKLNNLIQRLNKAEITEGYEAYKDPLESLANHYLKSFTVFEQQGLNEENINSFKEGINDAQNKLNDAHNSFIEILNSER